MANPKPSQRHKARRFSLQALYQWQMTEDAPATLEAQYRPDLDPLKVDIEYFHELLFGVIEHHAELDAYFIGYCDRSIDELDAIERVILRMSTYEMWKRIDVPYRVVINEALELSKTFGAIDSHKYINGVLDRVARKLRQAEMN